MARIDLDNVSLTFRVRPGGRITLKALVVGVFRPSLSRLIEVPGLGDFLNMPVRYYAASMLVRLACSIATAVDPEVLLIDEVLGVGDMSFFQKAQRRMHDMMDKAQIIVVVSHDLTSLSKLCDRGI